MRVRQYVSDDTLVYGISVYVDEYGNNREEISVTKRHGRRARVEVSSGGSNDPVAMRAFAAAVLRACEIAEALNRGEVPEPGQ